MHHRLEVLMPPTNDVATAMEKVLKQFSENDEENSVSFYDWYEIGGRWSGSHNLDGLDEALLDDFYKDLSDHNVTISSVQFGKQKLQPASQIPLVEQLWSVRFPGKCPIFDNYTGGGDIIAWVEAKEKHIKCSRFIITDNDLEPEYMTQEDFWNGVSHVKTTWDGTVKSAFGEYTEKLSHYKQEYAKKITPTDEWLLVTVDYHS